MNPQYNANLTIQAFVKEDDGTTTYHEVARLDVDAHDLIGALRPLEATIAHLQGVSRSAVENARDVMELFGLMQQGADEAGEGADVSGDA